MHCIIAAGSPGRGLYAGPCRDECRMNALFSPGSWNGSDNGLTPGAVPVQRIWRVIIMSIIPATTRRVVLAACVGTAFTLGIARAQTSQPASAPTTPAAAAGPAMTGTPAPAAPRLNIRDIYDRVEAAGYVDIREIEFERDRSGGHYEVKARNARGERVKLYVDAATGTIERERRHD